jgi:pilus assembly protein CpaF
MIELDGAEAEARLRARVRQRYAAQAGTPGGPPLRRHLAALLHDEAPLLLPDRFDATLDALLADVTGLGPLEPLLGDPSVTEVMLNGPGRCFVERGGVVTPVPCVLDAADILRLVERVLGPLGLRLDRGEPIVDARLADGSRVHVVIPPVAVDGPYVTIRRLSAAALPLEAFDLTGAAAAFLRWTIAAGWNLLVSGGTSTGKTTFLGALASAVAADERVVTIEETAELRIDRPHVVRLEARPANAEGVGAVDVRTLVRAALRMRPDRIVLGEVRGGEAFDLIQALNTGHDGSLGTVHANGAGQTLPRLEGLVLAGNPAIPRESLRTLLASALDAVVHLRRGPDGRREVAAVAEVDDGEDPGSRPVATRPLFSREGPGLRPRRRPDRPARRADAPPLDDGWFS